MKDRVGETWALHSLGVIYLKRDRLDDAKKLPLKAIEVAHAGDIIGEEALALYELALIRPTRTSSSSPRSTSSRP